MHALRCAAPLALPGRPDRPRPADRNQPPTLPQFHQKVCVSQRHAVTTLVDMPSIIPNLFSQATLTFSLAGLVRPLNITLGLQPGVGLTAAAQNAAIRTSFTGSGRPFNPVNMMVGYTLTETKILHRNGSGMLVVDIDPTVVTGTRVGDACPVNTSIIVRKNTLFGGKKYRGRFLVPPMYFQESLVAQNGVIPSGSITTYQTLWNDALTQLSGLSITPVLLHSDLTTPTQVTAFQVNNKIGTIGKRLR